MSFSTFFEKVFVPFYESLIKEPNTSYDENTITDLYLIFKIAWYLYKKEQGINEIEISNIAKGDQTVVQRRSKSNFIKILKDILNEDKYHYLIKSPYPIYKYLYNNDKNVIHNTE